MGNSNAQLYRSPDNHAEQQTRHLASRPEIRCALRPPEQLLPTQSESSVEAGRPQK